MGPLALMTPIMFILMVVQTFSQESNSFQFSYRGIQDCEEGWTSPDTPITTLTVSTPSACGLSCMQTSTCLSFNICGYEGGTLKCDLLPSTRSDLCSTMQAKSGCTYLEQHESPCKNGGTWIHPKCTCVDGFAGQYCERYIRSCQEGWDLGVKVSRYYWVQPFGSPVAYQLYCNLQYSKTAYFFVRKRNPSCPYINFDKTWQEYKDGWGDVDCGEYFLGLETMYQLMKYEQFQVHVYGQHNHGGNTEINYFYSDFTVQSDAENYRMNYSKGYNGGNQGDDGLGSEKPRDFCTRDRDCGSCASTNGGGWWYTSGCGGHPMTSTMATFQWPVGGSEMDLNEIYWQLDHMYYLP